MLNTSILVLVWLAVEILFWIIRTVLWPQVLDRLTQTPPCKLGPDELLSRVLDTIDMVPGFDIKKFFSGWCLGSNFSDIKTKNLEEVLAWAFFNKHREDLDHKEVTVTRRWVSNIQRRYGLHLADGYNHQVRACKFTLEPASPHVQHRPLAFYLMVGVLKLVGALALTLMGFTLYRSGRLHYWYRPASDRRGGEASKGRVKASSLLPFVFFHGISPGLWSYLPMLQTLVKSGRDEGHRAALFVELPHIGMGLSFRSPPTRTQTVGDMCAAFKKHGIERACISGHSFGTIVSTWLVQDMPHGFVDQLVLIDPVSILLCVPDVAMNMLYRQPRTISQRITRSVIAGELGIATTLRRHFFWYNNCLWPEDIKCPVIVHLSGKDDIIPSALSRGYLDRVFSKNKTQMHMMWSEEFYHGQLLFSKKRTQELARLMNSNRKAPQVAPEKTIPRDSILVCV